MSRRQQQELGAAVAGKDMEFVVLELPYIFGAMPGKIPLWQPLVDYVRSGVELVYTNGGSNMIAGAAERSDINGVFQVGDRNVSWVGDAFFLLHGKQSGLTPSNFARVQTAHAYFDPSESRSVLGYSGGGLEQAWRETVQACPETTRLKTLSGYVSRLKKKFGRQGRSQ